VPRPPGRGTLVVRPGTDSMVADLGGHRRGTCGTTDTAEPS